MQIVHLSAHSQEAKTTPRKVNHRTKAYMDNLEREFLLAHNKKFDLKKAKS